MVHIRKQIRDEMKNVLSAALPSSDYRVYSSRKSPLNHRASKATVDMKFLNDQTRLEETMGDARIHVPSLYVRIQRSGRESILDDLLDADDVLVQNAIEAYDWSDLLEEEPELVQTNFTDDGSTGNILGAIVLRYDLEYRMERGNPEIVID